MKLATLFFSLPWIASVISKTIPVHDGANTQSVGAVYTMNDEPSGNYILALEMDNTGNLTYKRAIYAGGNGMIGITTVNGGSLFSQGSIQVAPRVGLLATVNPGSNTVALFGIDPADPTRLDMVGKPVPSGGDFPISVAFNNAEDTLCVLNGGAVNGVRCFNVNRFHGLKAIKDSTRYLGANLTTPPVGPETTLSQLTFSNDDQRVIINMKGNPSAGQSGFFAIWDVASDGSLSKDFKYINNTLPGQVFFGITPIRNMDAYLVPDVIVGYDILSFSASAPNGNLTAVKVPGQVAICWSTYSPNTGSFYLIDFVDTITEISIGSDLSTQMIKQYQTTSDSRLLDATVASVNGKDFLYNLAAGTISMNAYALLGPGNAQQIQTLDLASAASKDGILVRLEGVQGAASYVKKLKS
ncbi:hypothetical protein AX17_002334 [Amanita inopinata Kibby_2008]|nr:hypothetical protein AX17_002334 [Amanita inopinata Kibby_2008]